MNHLPTAAQHHLHATELKDSTCHYKERERSKRERENETHSEIQGAGDTVNKYNQEHTTKTNKGHDKM